MDPLAQKLEQVKKAFHAAPFFLRPHLLPVLELLEMLVIAVQSKGEK